MYQALYRVFRPQTFADVTGQEHITRTLQNALQEQTYTHAYLFSGPRGTGKTSTAKILAKAINCEQAPTPEPCNTCAACQGITEGSVVDVLEIDAASNNGVEQIRDIRDHVKFAPTEVKKKVYIIDEVHMLSQGAFNALLKTLEEPPAHVVFILATTEPHKIPLTIISRCQRFDFKRIGQGDLRDRLAFICQEQHIDIEDDALKLLARVAEGGMRDALSLLDQAISYADDQVTLADCLAITGSVSQESMEQLAEALLSGAINEAMTHLHSLLQEGKEAERLLHDLIYYFRDLLLYQASPELEHLLERVQPSERFRILAQSTPRELIFHSLETLSKTQQQLKWSMQPRILLEVAFIQLGQRNDAESQEEPKAQKHTEELQSLPAHQLDTQSQQEIKQLALKVHQLEEQLKQWKQQDNSSQPEQEVKPKEVPVLPVSPSKVKEMLKSATKSQLLQLNNQWQAIMEEIRQQNVSVRAWLMDCQAVACSEEYFLLAFQNEIHRTTTERPLHRSIIEQVVQNRLKTPAKMLTIMYNEWSKIKEEFIREQRGEQTEAAEQEVDPFYAEAVKLVGEELIHWVDQKEDEIE